MERLGYYNGKYGPLEEMTVPMKDRALYERLRKYLLDEFKAATRE